MEQFIMTGAIGTGAAGVAEKAGQAITKKIVNKVIKGAIKQIAEPII